MNSVKKIMVEKVKAKIQSSRNAEEWWDTLPGKKKRKVKDTLGLDSSSDSLYSDLPAPIRSEVSAYYQKHNGIVKG